MPTTKRRRPLPAVVFLLVLGILSFIVWWRVLHRPDTSTAAAPAVTVTSLLCSTATNKAIVLPKPATVTLRVLNGAGRDGLAAQIGTQLRGLGFTKISTADTASFSRSAEIRFGPKAKAAAALLSFYVPGSVLVPVHNSTAVVDVAVSQKFRALTPRTAIAAAIAKAAKSC